MLEQTQFRAMGTDVTIAIAHNSSATHVAEVIRPLLANVKLLLDSLEQQLSRFIPGNELDRLNHSNGVWINLSSELTTVLELAEGAHFRSGGLFSPFLGASMKAIGYTQSFDSMKQNSQGVPKDKLEVNLVTGTLSKQGPGSPIDWSKETGQVRLKSAIEIDLGGIAKGWIVEQVAERLRSEGIADFIVDAGGDMVCAGSNGGSPWRIGIENPMDADKQLVIDVTNTSVATSGTYRRQWQRDGEIVHHIIDPRTGRPADTNILSCSVFHPSLIEAEWMAKAVLILGRDEGMRWISQQQHRGWVVITEEKGVEHAWT